MKMTLNPTKHYSSKQEQMIADYLGWTVVSASGARPFNPGDIQSMMWLGECKTHVTVKDKVSIKKSVWEKITNEAQSVLRKPALFIDNGSQKVEDTYVLFRKPKYEVISETQYQAQIRESSTGFSFSHAKMKVLLAKGGYNEISISGVSLMLMRLPDFRGFINRRSENV